MKQVYTEDQAKSINARIDNKKAIANQSKNDRRVAIEEFAETKRLHDSFNNYLEC